MKRRLTLIALAVALGIVEWRQSSGVHADEAIPAAFEQTEPAVVVAPEPATENDEDESPADASSAASDDDESPVAESTSDAANAEPPVVDDDEPVAVDVGVEDSADRSSQESGAEELPGASKPPVRIAGDGAEVEVIRERYPNRTVKIEREVTQDPEGNYVNHGSFKMFDAQGSLLVEGQFHYGERIGVWNRWYRTADVELLKAAPYNLFHGPFISQASFDLGHLNGKWTIYDSHQHRISEWTFVDGERQGDFIWWFPNGQKMRECHYDAGELNGKVLEWGPNTKLLTQDNYEHGRKLGSRVEKHRSGGNKSEGTYLFAREILQTPDDWWNAKPATYAKQGKDERHGHWVTWYPNGQKQNDGEYDHDVQVGDFTWWYASGQRALKGVYSDGEQQGKWVWWHENGQKSIQGEYRQGHPIGHWTWWNQDGKIARASDLEQGAGAIVQTPAPLPKASPAAPRSASRPNAAPGQPRPSAVR